MKPPPVLDPHVARKFMLGLALLCCAGILFAQTNPASTPPSPAPSAAAPEVTSANPQHSLSESAATAGMTVSSDATDPAQAAPASSTLVQQAAPLPSPVEPPSAEPAKYDPTQIGHRNIGTGLNFYSLEREIAVGQDLAKQVEQSSKLVTDPDITAYINRIGQNLVRNSDSRVPFTIKVIDSGEVNAFALPGGFFYVDTGLILAAESEAELAAVMAHEIAHVAARHATKNMTKQQIWNMASIPLMFVGGPAGYAIAEVASIAVPMSFLKFSRDSEREADMLGLQYDYAAGYDPQAFIQFFERLKAEEKNKHSKIGKLFSTHPMTADRISAAQNEIKQYFPDRDAYIVDTSEFDAMKTRLLAIQTGHRGGMDKGPNRPVLRNKTEDAPVAPPPAQDTASTASTPTDDGPPVLKRAGTDPL